MRKSIVAAALVAAALTLVGCSSTTTGSPTAGTGPSTAGVTPTTFSTAEDLAAGVGAATKDKGSATLKFDFGVAGQSITGTGAYAGTGADTKLKMSMTIPQQGDIEMVLLDKNIYIKIPGAQSAKPWIKAPLDASNPIGAQFSSFGDQLDVSKQFEQLKDGGKLTGSAPDTVDGTPATKYTISLDPNKLAENGTPEQKQAMQTLTQQGVKTIDMQVWTDSANLPLRVSTSIPVQGQNTTFDMHYSGWGQPVDIAAPPADQVTDGPN